MSKSFNVSAAQLNALTLRHNMLGRRYRHYKGGIYRVMWLDVDESTGEVRVSYKSESIGNTWSRTLADFVEIVDGKPRFELLDEIEMLGEYDMSGGERGKYAKRYAEGVTVAIDKTDALGRALGNCHKCGRTLHVRGYRCPTHGLSCAYCVHDWKCHACGARVELETL